MASSRCFFLSFQLMLALFIVSLVVRKMVAGDSETENVINTVCRQMEEFGFCSQIFHENLKGPTDYVGLTQIANAQTIINATNTLRYIQLLLPSIRDVGLKNDVIVCENAYNIVSQAFREGNEFFFRRDYKSMLNAERIAPRAQASCSEIFGTPPVKQSPLVERNREMRILIAMALVSGFKIAS